MISEEEVKPRPCRALVAGGSGAIGGAVCLRLAQAGADVALTYMSKPEAARKVADRVRSLERTCLVFEVDLADETAVVEVADRAARELGGLDTAISAIGLLPPQKWTSQIDVATYRRHLDAEAGGFFAFVKAVLPHLRDRGGSLVAVGSVAARHHVARDVLSGSPKAAMESVVRAIAQEEGRHGVRANIVGVGILAEGMAAELVRRGELTSTILAETAEALPLRRLGRVEEIAEAVVFLASDEASYVTGQSLDVDGGYAV